MANLIKYSYNVGKSLGYSAIEQFKELTPAITSFKDANDELYKTVTSTVKSVVKLTKDKDLSDSKIKKYATDLASNVLEDIKSGKLYNKERLEKASDEAAKSFAGIEDDMDFSFDDDSSFSFDDDDISTNEMMDTVAEKSTNAVSSVIARSADYQATVSRKNTKALYDQQNILFSKLHTDIGTVNSNIASIIEFSKEATVAHYNNAKIFFENESTLSKERNDILKEILEIQKNMYGKKEENRYNSDSVSYGDIVDAKGMPNLLKYFDAIKSNLKGSGGGIGDTIEMLVSYGMVDTMIANPLSFIPNTIVKGLIPKAVKNSMGKLDQTLGNVFGNTILKMNKLSGSTNPVLSFIGNMLGLNTSVKDKLSTRNYEKGPIPFDGVTKKSIVEVIPTYLSKILNALTGKKEMTYDFEEGKFISRKQLQEDFDNIKKSRVNSTFFDTRSYMNAFNRKVDFNKMGFTQEEFDKALDAFFMTQFDNSEVFNSKAKNISAASYGIKGDKADLMMKLITQYWDNIPDYVKMGIGPAILDNKESLNSYMETLERDGSVYSQLFNNSNLSNERKNKSSKESESKKNKAKNKNKDKTKTSSKKDKDDTTPIRDEDYANSLQEALKNISIEEDELSNEKKEESEGFLSYMGIGKKGSTLGKLKEAAAAPGNLLSAILDKVNSRVYTLFFGEEKGERDLSGIIEVMTVKMKTTFDKFNGWLDEKILSPLSKKFTKENAKNAVKNFFNIFGIDIEQSMNSVKEYFFGKQSQGDDPGKEGVFTKFFNKIKDGFSSVGDYIKNAFKSIGEWLGVFGKKKKKKSDNFGDAFKEKEDKDYNQDDYKFKMYASGTRRVDKTGVAVVSEGEMIIPPDMNPYNINQRKKNESQAAKNFLNTYGMPGFSEGGTFEGQGEANKDNSKATSYEDMNIFGKMGVEARNLIDFIQTFVGNVKTNVMGRIDKEDLKDRMNKGIFQELKEAVPDMTVGGIIGGGLGLITGLGPVLGVLVGSSIAFAKDSDTAKDWLFGAKDKETGKRGGKATGGKLPTSVMNAINKYAPNIGKGATIGAITSVLPFIPGGPVAGIIVGSAVGFASKNEKIQEALFGEHGSMKELPGQLKRALPKMGLGSIIGAIGGPFGMTANIVLGAALGYATETEVFKERMFGVDDGTGKRTGGVFDFIKKFTEENVVNPLKEAKDPIKRQIELVIQDTGSFLKDKIDRFFDTTIGGPLKKFFIQKILNPVGKLAVGFLGTAAGAVALPFAAVGRGVGAVGTSLRKRQIKRGTANYMTAAERLAYRRDHNMDVGDVLFGRHGISDNYQETDEMLANMNTEQIESAYHNIQQANANKSSIRKRRRDTTNKIKGIAFDNKLSLEVSNTIRRLATSGQIEDAIDYINRLDISNNEKEELIKQIKPYAEEMGSIIESESNMEGARNNAFTKLRSMGFNITDKNSKRIEELLAKEMSGRGIGQEPKEKTEEEKLDEKADKRIELVTNRIDKVLNLLGIIASSNPDIDDINKENINSLISGKAKGFGAKIDRVKDVKTQFENGKSIRYVKDKNGKWVVDKSDSDTNKALKEQEQEKAENKSIFQKMVDIPGKIFGFLGGDKDKDEKKNNGIFGTILSGVFKVAGFATLLGFLPKLNDLYQSTIKPILSGLFDNVSSALGGIGENVKEKFVEAADDDGPIGSVVRGITSIVQFVTNIPGWIKGETSDGGLPVFLKDKVIPFYLEGFEFTMSAVVPKMAEIVITALPSIIKGFGRGIGNMLTNITRTLRGEKTTEEAFSFTPKSKDSDSIESIDMGNGTTGISDSYQPSSAWNTKNSSLSNILDFGDTSKGAGLKSNNTSTDITDTSSGFDTASNIAVDTINESTGPVSTKLPKAFENVSSNVAAKASTQYLQVKDSETDIIGKDGNPMTVEQLLNSKEVVIPKSEKMFKNEITGEYMDVRGVDILKYPQIASYYGIDVSSSAEEKQAAENNMGYSKENRSLGQRLTKYGLIKFLTGKAGGAGVFTKIGNSKLLGKFGLAGKGIKAASKLTGSIGTTAADAGKMLMPEWAIGKSSKEAGNKMKEEGTSWLSKLLNKNKTKDAAKETAKNKAKEEISKNAVEMAEDSAVDWAEEYLEWGAKEAAEEAAENTAKNAAKEITENIAEDGLKKQSKSIFSKFADTQVTQLLKKAATSIKSLITKLFDNSKIKSIFSKFMKEQGEELTEEAAEKACKEIGEKIGKEVSETIVSKSAKVVGSSIGKVVGNVLSGGFITIAFAIAAFIHGYNKAGDILGITKSVGVPVKYKFIAAVVNAINEVCGGLLDSSMIFEIILNIISNHTPIDTSEIESLKEQSNSELAQWNAENGMDLSMEEYNNKDTIGTKIANTVKNAWKNFTSGDYWESAKDRLSNMDFSGTSYNNQSVVKSSTTSAAKGSGLLSKVLAKFSAKGSGLNNNGTFVSQVDDSIANVKFGDETIGEAGCGPAAATMAINSTLGNRITMSEASRMATGYKEANGGVQATYFKSVFDKYGVGTNYITDQDTQSRSQKIIDRLKTGNSVVLMGRDPSNTSKSKSPFGPNAHYVVATGLSDDGSKVIINDPESKQPGIAYDTNKVISKSELGVEAYSASGSSMSPSFRRLVSRYTARGTAPRYNLTESEINFIGRILTGEGASYQEHAEALASHLANLYEARSDFQKFGSIYKWLKTTNSKGNYGNGWFSKNSLRAKPSAASIAAIKKCLVNGERVLPANVIEFDFYKASSNSGDIRITDGSTVNNAVRGKTKVKSNLGAGTGKFYCYYGDGKKNASSGNLFWVPDSCKIDPDKFNTSAPTGGAVATDTTTETQSGTMLDDILGVFDGLAQSFGLSASTTTTTDTSDTTTTSGGGGLSSNASIAEKQQALVDKMLSVKGKLSYSMSGPRNPEKGSADCSSTVGWAYKKVLGINPGGNTEAQLHNTKDFVTVDTGNGDKVTSTKPDESKLQLGDLLLFSRPTSGFTAGRDRRVGHVEMYMGNGQQIGHGGGMGPKVKKLQDRFIEAKRAKVLVDNASAKGSGLSAFSGDDSYVNKAIKYATSSQMRGQNDDIKLSSMSARGTSSSLAQLISEASAPVNYSSKTKSTNSEYVILLRAIIKVLMQISKNTTSIDTIVTLLSEITVTEDTGSKEELTSLLKTTLAAITDATKAKPRNDEQNSELQALLTNVEKLALE